MTAQQFERILEALRIGHHVVVACKMAGVSRTLFYARRKSDPALEARVEEAMAEAENACLKAIMAEPQWTARAWVLERRFAQRWAKKSDLAPPTTNVVNGIQLPTDRAERAKVLRAMADREDGGGKS